MSKVRLLHPWLGRRALRQSRVLAEARSPARGPAAHPLAVSGRPSRSTRRGTANARRRPGPRSRPSWTRSTPPSTPPSATSPVRQADPPGPSFSLDFFQNIYQPFLSAPRSLGLRRTGHRRRRTEKPHESSSPTATNSSPVAARARFASASMTSSKPPEGDPDGRGLFCALPVIDALARPKTPIDAFISYTDSETWDASARSVLLL